MRHDATIDRKQVVCKNASHLGFDKATAQVGDLVQFSIEDGGPAIHLGRMIGRIHYAPALEQGDQPIRDWILVGKLSSDLTYVSEFWVNPLNVSRVHAIREQLATMKWFLGDDIKKQPTNMVRQCLSELWSTFDNFLAYQLKRESEQAEYDRRKEQGLV